VAGEPGSEIYSVAGDADQAAICFEAARRMLEQNPDLLAISKTYRNSIVNQNTGAHYKVLSSEHASKHGYSPELVIFDELHVQRNRDLWDVMRTGMGARQEPLMLAITTAGIFDKTSIAWEIYDYAKKVDDGIIDDPTFYAAIWEAPHDADWTDEDVWIAANPSLNETVAIEFLRTECAAARETPSYQNTFRRLYLNQWTEQVERWLDMYQWDECAGKIDAKTLEGRKCYGGLDLSTTTDIAAWTLLFPRTGGYDVLCRFFVPAESIEKRARKDQVPYPTWKKQGFIEATPGNVIDYSFIRRQINEDAKRFRLIETGYDPWNATQLAQQLQDEDGLRMVEIRQGFASMNEPTKELEGLVIEKGINHGGNPVLRWMASNVSVKRDPADNLKPDKQTSTERIDGIVSLICALARAIQRTDHRSVYEDRGIIEL
jgi:phage terminase large subunit-like protein